MKKNTKTTEPVDKARDQEDAQAWAQRRYAAYIGLDVHKDTIAVSVADGALSCEPQYLGEIPNRPKSVCSLVERLEEMFSGEFLFCYEAGPCGYALYRQLIETRHDCIVVAPSLIPRKPGERVKNDRRDSIKLAHALRSGILTSVWVPGERQEAMRNLVRVRADMKRQQQTARQQLNAFVLRSGHNWPGNKSRWTQSYFRWLEDLKFPDRLDYIVLGEYVNAAREAEVRVSEISGQIELARAHWSLNGVIEALVALRGIDRLSATVLMAELGDISRFDEPQQLFSYLGLVPSEYASGGKRRQGGITRSGNGHARRTLVECAWSYRFPARKTRHMRCKSKDAPQWAQEISWKAQKRLCGRYAKMAGNGKDTRVIIVAIARELAGFVWDIVRREMGRVDKEAA